MSVAELTAAEPDVRIERCEVCIVGAGLTGLNALFVASRYLPADRRVLIVDRRERVGGMWVDTYPYVRLHQPHPMFTAGNIAWTLGRDPAYLATKTEVLDHFQYCLDVIRQRIRVDEFFGWDVESHDETDGTIRIDCQSSGGQRMIIEAKQLINAAGFQVKPNEPLEVSSHRILSVSPDFCDMRSGEMRSSGAPVWIIGGGKTAMDTAHALITEYPGREVNMVAGSGTYFVNRDRFFPTGVRRWWRGKTFTALGAEVTRRFDGTNETAVADWFRSTYGTRVTPEAGNFLLGMLSNSENDAIAAGLNHVIMDHLVDAVDRNGATDLVLRSGSTKTIEPGSWIVNCTGYFKKPVDRPYVPYVSRGGSVVSIQPRSMTLQLMSFMGYFMSHLLMLNKIRDVPLYELDAMDLRNKSNVAFAYTLFTLAQYNLSLILEAVPLKVFSECGLDFNRWFPAPRQLVGTTQFALTHRRGREHLRHSLDTVRDRFDVRCGPVV